MKNFKRTLTVVLAVAVMFALSSIAAFAAGTKSITLTGGKAGHTYTAYQIFTGTVDDKGTETTDDDELTNIQWGTDASAAYKAAYPTAAAAAKAIATQDDARATAQQLVANGYLGTGTSKPLSADGDVEFTGLDEGYYVIVDTNGNQSVTEGDYTSAYIVKVVKDVTGAVKGSGATSDKTIKGKDGNAVANDTDAAAYNIGDAVPFQLKATTADNVANYKKYHITFQDKQSAGLDAPTKFTISVPGHTFENVTVAELTEGVRWTSSKGTQITLSKATPDSGYSFAIKVEFEPVAVGETPAATYLDAECNSADITVDYTAVLNSNAEIGLPGNANEMHITYSNNPESTDGNEEGKTPDDTVKVFTYKTVIDKVDADSNALEGAGFTIYMEVPQGTEGAKQGVTLRDELTTANPDINVGAIANDRYYVPKAMTTVSGNNAQFEFKGLADGTYVLVETTIPDGFNAFKAVEFTISSTVAETGITTLEGTAPFTTTNPGADKAVTATNGHELDSGELYAEIKNNSGAELPETGGMGTKIFMIAGLILIAGAAITLVVRRRMQSE